MAKRTNHYDAAFEAYLRRARVPFVVVDEARRARLNQLSLKSMDFIVTAPGNRNLLVDVKGRQFPSGRGPESARTRAGARLGDRPGALHEGGLGRRVQDAHDEFDRVNVVEREGSLFDVAFDLRPEGTTDGGERDVHQRAAIVHRDIAHHAQFDDGGPEFGVEHLAEALSKSI
jgi:hypothetical protein